MPMSPRAGFFRPCRGHQKLNTKLLNPYLRLATHMRSLTQQHLPVFQFDRLPTCYIYSVSTFPIRRSGYASSYPRRSGDSMAAWRMIRGGQGVSGLGIQKITFPFIASSSNYSVTQRVNESKEQSKRPRRCRTISWWWYLSLILV